MFGNLLFSSLIKVFHRCIIYSVDVIYVTFHNSFNLLVLIVHGIDK